MIRTNVSDFTIATPCRCFYIGVMCDVPDISLRIGSYNIRAGLGTDLRRNPARTLATIIGLKTQMMVLQEADFRMGHRPSALPRRLIADTGLCAVDFGGHPDSLGWHGIALLVAPEITVNDRVCIDLPGLEPRGAIIADAETPIGPLRIVGVHLGLLRSARRRQLDHLRQTLGDMHQRPTVIIGDFNEWSLRRGLGRIARGFVIKTPGRSFPSRLPLLALDRIAHSPELNLSTLPLPPLPKGAHASDHLPILAEITRPAVV